ncbi:MAG: 30S ribosomal protein S20 [Coxiellaceae bacterium]|nr:30S ribosomal protein S20 [Coxiellaceae bacterium]
MANSPQAIKRARQSDKRREQNTSLRSALRTEIKKVLKLVAEGDKTKAAEQYKTTVPAIDKLAGKSLIPANKAARLKSRLNAKVRAIA